MYSVSTDLFVKYTLDAEHDPRLAKSERSVRAELHTFKKAAVERESELQKEIDRLRKLVRNSSPV